MTDVTENNDGSAVGDNERLVFFSDAVVAIALTLLALELPVPHGASDTEVWRALREHFADYAMFLLSFAVISELWVAHKWLFGRVEGFTPRLVWLNFVWLLGTVLIPFATKVLIEDGDYQVSAVLFAVVVGGTGLVLISIVRHCRARGLLRPDAAPDAMRRFQLVIGLPTVAFLLSVPVAFVSLSAAKYSWVATFVLTVVAARWSTHPRGQADLERSPRGARR
ncbi:TMEM175 family protein [Streptomyces sp. CA-249302]|uniref:TMEM175 family protein n=1 Tax=Streptomyces sp. CA-249302 TaxID=3240058 RepID=UPI003D944F22